MSIDSVLKFFQDLSDIGRIIGVIPPTINWPSADDHREFVAYNRQVSQEFMGQKYLSNSVDYVPKS